MTSSTVPTSASLALPNTTRQASTVDSRFERSRCSRKELVKRSLNDLPSRAAAAFASRKSSSGISIVVFTEPRCHIYGSPRPGNRRGCAQAGELAANGSYIIPAMAASRSSGRSARASPIAWAVSATFTAIASEMWRISDNGG
jgi:hypothetical protein